MSVPSYMFVEAFTSLLPVALGFAAGCMVWIAFAELIPDALESADHGHVATAATFSAAWWAAGAVRELEVIPKRAAVGSVSWHKK